MTRKGKIKKKKHIPSQCSCQSLIKKHGWLVGWLCFLGFGGGFGWGCVETTFDEFENFVDDAVHC